MKVLLMNLPEMVCGTRTIVPSLGLEYLASNISKKHEIKLIEQQLYASMLWSDGSQEIWGISANNMARVIATIKPDVIGISCSFSYQHEFLKNYIKSIKNIFPNIKIIAGGNHVTAWHKNNPKIEGLDAYIMGEGEIALNLYLEGKMEEGTVYQVENIDNLNFPNRQSLPEYFKINKPHFTKNRKGAKIASIISSRGCPYNCIFCSVKTIWGKKFRGRSPENVMAEVEQIVKEYGVDEIHFEDDNLLFDKARMLKICELLTPYKIKWTCPNGVDMSKLDDELLAAMVKSGCYRITICPESYNDNVLRFYRKHFNTKMIGEKVELIRKYPIELVGFFIIGAPKETEEEVLCTIIFANQNFDDYSISFLTPYIGTDLYGYCKDNKLFVKEDFYSFRADILNSFERAIPKDRLMKLWNLSNKLKRRNHGQANDIIHRGRPGPVTSDQKSSRA